MASIIKSQLSKFIFLLLAIGCVFATGFSVVDEGMNVIIETSPESTVVRWKVYWKNPGLDFTEEKSALFRPHENGAIAVSNIKRASNISQIRLDIESRFPTVRIKRIFVERRQCIWSVDELCNTDLVNLTPAVSNDVEISGSEVQIVESRGPDPYVVWDLPSHLKGRRPIFLANFGIIPAMFLIVGIIGIRFLGGEWGRASAAALKATIALAIYIVFLIVEPTGSRFFGTITLGREVFLFCCIFFFALLFLQLSNAPRVFHQPARLAAIVVLIGALLPNFLFHISVIDSWQFGSEPDEYHWRLGRSFSENYQRSSLKYEEEFREIKHHIIDGSRVLSDTATSLYLAAHTDLFVVNPLAHHRSEDDSVTDSEILELCSADSGWERISAILERLRVDYLVLNQDRENKNITASCPRLRSNALVRQFPSRFEEVMRGEFLRVFKIRLGT